MCEGASLDNRSSQWLEAPSHRYPPEILPRLIRYAPSNTAIGFWAVSRDVLNQLHEDKENHTKMGLTFTVLNEELRNLYFPISHMPKWPSKNEPPQKDEADEVAKCLLNATYSQSFEWVMCFSKYDMLVHIKEGVDPTSLAISLKSHMSYGVRSRLK